MWPGLRSWPLLPLQPQAPAKSGQRSLPSRLGQRPLKSRTRQGTQAAQTSLDRLPEVEGRVLPRNPKVSMKRQIRAKERWDRRSESSWLPKLRSGPASQVNRRALVSTRCRQARGTAPDPDPGLRTEMARWHAPRCPTRVRQLQETQRQSNAGRAVDQARAREQRIGSAHPLEPLWQAPEPVVRGPKSAFWFGEALPEQRAPQGGERVGVPAVPTRRAPA